MWVSGLKVRWYSKDVGSSVLTVTHWDSVLKAKASEDSPTETRSLGLLDAHDDASRINTTYNELEDGGAGTSYSLGVPEETVREAMRLLRDKVAN